MLILTQHIPIHSHHLLTPLSRVLLENVTRFQLVKKYPTFYGTRRFITAFTSARHLSPSHSNYSTFLNTCKLTSSPKYLFISLCLIMIGKNFSLYLYITSVLRCILCGSKSQNVCCRHANWDLGKAKRFCKLFNWIRL